MRAVIPCVFFEQVKEVCAFDVSWACFARLNDAAPVTARGDEDSLRRALVLERAVQVATADTPTVFL